MARARYIMIGGFLGAGKSTALVRLAGRLKERGLRVGLITNDQGADLVDTSVARGHGFDVEEIPGGCFCCRFDSLVEAADKLSRGARPDVFLAEPVGSCTDLVAAVTHPLQRLYGEAFDVAPLSVLVDPIRALRTLGLEPGPTFSPKVNYIYRKQIEEAHCVVVNKSDVLDEQRRELLVGGLRERFPAAELFLVSARFGTGLEPWLDYLGTRAHPRDTAMQLDYDAYAEGEALLGWLNCSARVEGQRPFDGGQLMTYLARAIHERLSGAAYEVAHLKMTLTRDGRAGQEAVLNLVRTDFVPELSQASEPFSSGRLTINLRAEAPPDWLRSAVLEAIDRRSGTYESLSLRVERLEHFRPARPNPTHRMAEAY